MGKMLCRGIPNDESGTYIHFGTGADPRISPRPARRCLILSGPPLAGESGRQEGLSISAGVGAAQKPRRPVGSLKVQAGVLLFGLPRRPIT